jgi:hypothetical protein
MALASWDVVHVGWDDVVNSASYRLRQAHDATCDGTLGPALHMYACVANHASLPTVLLAMAAKH